MFNDTASLPALTSIFDGINFVAHWERGAWFASSQSDPFQDQSPSTKCRSECEPFRPRIWWKERLCRNRHAQNSALLNGQHCAAVITEYPLGIRSHLHQLVLGGKLLLQGNRLARRARAKDEAHAMTTIAASICRTPHRLLHTLPMAASSCQHLLEADAIRIIPDPYSVNVERHPSRRSRRFKTA